ncbi:MAG: TonB family protein [Verrucomicrobia bacterium]|nr:TonB family protein [Verrucomicrobiota bacterium]
MSPSLAEKPASSPLAPSPLMTVTPRPTPKPTPRPAKALAHAESATKPLATPRATVTPAKPSTKQRTATKPSPNPKPSSDESASEHAKRTAAKKENLEENKPAPSPGKSKSIAASANQAKNEHTVHKLAESADSNKSEKTGSSGSDARKGEGSGADNAGIGRYAEIIHNRFFAAWNQPQSEMALGAHLVATVKLHIESDGAVTDFDIVEGSGNPVVDQSVREAGKKITRLPPPPNGEAFSPIIRFELGD